MNSDVDFSDKDYIKKALTGTPSQSDVIASKYTGKPVVTVAYPLKYEGKSTGDVVGVIDFKKISKDATNINVGKKGYAYMINKEGTIICHSDDNKVLKENISNTDNAELKALVEKMKSGKAGSGNLIVEVKISTGDEIEDLGRTFNAMIKHQHNMMEHITKSSEEMTAAWQEMASYSEEISALTDEITQNIGQVSCNAEKQDKAIVEASEVLGQLSSLVQITQNKALLTEKNSDYIINNAKEGRVMVKETVAAINCIKAD